MTNGTYFIRLWELHEDSPKILTTVPGTEQTLTGRDEDAAAAITQTTATPALWLPTWGGHEETPRATIHVS